MVSMEVGDEGIVYIGAVFQRLREMLYVPGDPLGRGLGRRRLRIHDFLLVIVLPEVSHIHQHGGTVRQDQPCHIPPAGAYLMDVEPAFLPVSHE